MGNRTTKIKMEEGNFITKYWLKKFVWYDWRFLIQLPLFIAYIWIQLIMLFVFIGLQLLSLFLEGLTNIKMWKYVLQETTSHNYHKKKG